LVTTRLIYKTTITNLTQNETTQPKIKFSFLMCLSVAILAGLSLTISHGLASSQQNKTLMQSQGIQGMTANATNIVLVHGA
jgi:hypothetical protein